jgi:hypothetical protein
MSEIDRDDADVAAMELRRTVWENLAAAMTRRWGKVHDRRLARAIRGSPATVNRLKNQRQDIGLDLLSRLARAVDLEPYQLLVRGIVGPGPKLSPKAIDLATSLDAIEDPTRRATAFALASHAIHALKTAATEEPSAPVDPHSEPAPGKKPGRESGR